MIEAKIIADSKNTLGQRITTMLVIMPRYILAEFNTHRALSRNSASSRAIPFKRMLKLVWEQPFIPVAWMKDHTGMQGTEYFESNRKIKLLRLLWLTARTFAVCMAFLLHKAGLTKQISNRLLEPFMYHKVLVTGTEWENFFALRADRAADIHMQMLAQDMLTAYNNSDPKQLHPGEWHMPYGDQIDEAELCRVIDNKFETIPYGDPDEIDLASYCLKVATARCARTSYITLGDNPVKHDYEKDIKLHDTLERAGHWSPFEHCARAMDPVEFNNAVRTPRMTNYKLNEAYGWMGNFQGFLQYRKMFNNENRKDSRIINK